MRAGEHLCDLEDLSPSMNVYTNQESDVASSSGVCNFKAGDKVILKGLRKQDLHGQAGHLLFFKSATKERLPVKLDTLGDSVSIKLANLRKISEENLFRGRRKVHVLFQI